ncbi:TolC family protein [Aquimarina agarivorans]|uniref:TolC family protein n=1 Tax=Aquimarina agarivorans TaxID=980584 RepID=UPI000248F8E3|nr:TolC family protein [Aquimarina agarivorans]
MKTKNILSILFILVFSGFSNAQELQSLIDKALINNPKIKQFELQYKRVSEKVNEVNTLPNTNIGVGYFVSEPETRTGAQRFKVSVNQMLPWFGTISSREDYVNSLADAKFEDITIAKRQLIASVSTSYYNLYAIKAKQQVLTKNIDLLKTYETMALTSVEVGKASVVDVLRLQMRQNDLNQSKAVLQQQFLAEQTAFNKLLNRDKNTIVNAVLELGIPLDDRTINLDSLQFHPELIKYDKLYQSVEKSELLNQKESSPMIGFGLDYVNVAQRPDMNFNDNGKDIVMPMVSFSIPIFNKKYKSKTKQNEIQQEEFNTQKQERFNKLETLLDKAINERTTARIRYNNQSKNLKQAKNAETILVKSYETGTIDFNDVLDIQELQLKFQLNQIKAVQNYYVQSAIINYLIQ